MGSRTRRRGRPLEYGDLVGLPYGWREAGTAYDCFTLIAEVFHRLGWNYAIPVQIREQFPEGDIRTSEIDPDVWLTVPTCSQIGDVALIRGPIARGRDGHDGTARHCAIMVAPGLMIEATAKHGVHTIRWNRIAPFTVRCVRYSEVFE